MSVELYRPGMSRAERDARESRALLYGVTRRREVWTSSTADEDFTRELAARVRADKDAVVAVWGDAGSGKSTFVLDRCRKLDPTFTPKSLVDRVAFKASDVPRLYERTPRYGVAWIDEAASSGLLSSESPFSVRQKSLVELVSIIRAKNVVLFVVIPNPDDLAKSFRVRRSDYRVEVHPAEAGRPPVAWLGRRVRGRHFYTADSRWLGFSDEKHGIPLRWPDYRTSADPVLAAYWAAYEPLKLAFLPRRVGEIALELDADERKASGRRRRRGEEE